MDGPSPQGTVKGMTDPALCEGQMGPEKVGKT
jgi:hypothetical protein